VRERVPLAGLRRATAERLRRAVDGPIPLTLTREARAGALAGARRGRADSDGVALPWDALFARALGDALRERPELNAVLAGEEILLLDEVHVGFAVSVPDGLVVPVLRDADRRPLAELAADVRALAARARAGALRPEDVLGGTVTLTNLGGHGVDAFTPVLNPPQSAILGVGRLAPRPVVEPGGTLAVAETCVLSLTFDHRVTDGAPAAELLAAVARRLDDRAWWEGVR
jgi:pyruvate dehydrogenase E2 component (dihydrolipoamide acetyltransferase)